MRKATKTIISFAVVLIAGLNIIVPAFAQEPFTSIAIGGLGGASGAGLFGSMAGMSGIDIGWPQSGADPLDAMYNVLNPDHIYFSGEKHEADPQADPEDVWDYITVDLGDWLDAQSNFIVNFAQANNVQDNDSGSVTTNPSFYGYPLDSSGYSELGYVNGVGTYTFGPFTLTVTSDRPNGYNCSATCANGTYDGQGLRWYIDEIGTFPWKVGFQLSGGRWHINVWHQTTNNWRRWTNAGANATGTVTPATNVPWTSDTVDTQVFDGWENAKVKIPHSISGLQPGWTIPDFTNALNDLWSQGLQGQIVIEDTDQPVPPPPIPDTPLGEVPFDDWIDLWGQGIWSQLENQSDALDFIGSNGTDAIEELESIDENIGALEETAESIDTNIGVGNGILGGIRSLAQSAVDYLEGIAEHVGELVEEIVEGTETLIAGILNQIPQIFSVIFGPIKQASSIWHYVVEWIQSIGSPFQFIWSMASGTSYYIILPVYASLAASVVLAFYKRFGK